MSCSQTPTVASSRGSRSCDRAARESGDYPYSAGRHRTRLTRASRLPRASLPGCPASRRWRVLGFGRVGDGGVGVAAVDLDGAVPSDRLVGSDGGVLDAVVLGVGCQVRGVWDLFEEHPARTSGTRSRVRVTRSARGRTRVRTWRSSGWVVTGASNRKDRNGPPLPVTIVTTGWTLPSSSTSARSTSGRPGSWSASPRASSTALTRVAGVRGR